MSQLQHSRTGNGLFKKSSLNDYPLQTSRIGNVLIKLTSHNDYHLWEGSVSPTDQFKQSLDSFYVTSSPLSVTNIAELAMF